MHAVLEEGQQHFSSVDEAQRWLAKREKFMDYVSTRDGLVVGWKQQARKNCRKNCQAFCSPFSASFASLPSAAKPSVRNAGKSCQAYASHRLRTQAATPLS